MPHPVKKITIPKVGGSKSNNVAQSTVRAAAIGGIPGAVAGFVNSAWENNQQMAADRRSRKFADEQAEKQFNRQKYFDSLEKRWNSEQSQVQRFRDAGLNPNLMYGDLSSSTAATPSVPLPQTPNGVSRDFSVDSSALQSSQIGLDSVLKASQIDNINQNTAQQYQDTKGKDIENRFKETGIIQTLTEQLERINKIRADIEKTGADTKTVDALRDSLVEQLAAEISLNKQRIEESKQNVEKSKQDVTESKQRVTKSKQDVTESKQRVTESKQRIDESKQNINESKSRESLNRATEQLKNVETKDLLLKYNVNNDQYQMINKYVHDHDLPAGSEKVIIQALENFAQSLGKKVPEVTLDVIGGWLSADNWLNYMAQEHRTDAIRDGNNESVDGTFAPPAPSQQNNGDSGLQRNGDKYEQQYDRSYTPNQKRYIDVAKEKYKYLNYDKQQEYWHWLSKENYHTQYERAEKIQHLFYEQYGHNDLDKIRQK